jgi:hypothetical protein
MATPPPISPCANCHCHQLHSITAHLVHAGAVLNQQRAPSRLHHYYHAPAANKTALCTSQRHRPPRAYRRTPLSAARTAMPPPSSPRAASGFYCIKHTSQRHHPPGVHRRTFCVAIGAATSPPFSPHMAATATKHHSDSAQPGLPALLHSTGQGHIMDHINCIISRAYHTISAKHSLYNITGITAHLDSGQGRHPRLERRGQPTPHHPFTPVVHTEAPGEAMPSRSVHQPAHHRSCGPPALPLQRTIITQRLGENRPPDTTGTGITGFPE